MLILIFWLTFLEKNKYSWHKFFKVNFTKYSCPWTLCGWCYSKLDQIKWECIGNDLFLKFSIEKSITVENHLWLKIFQFQEFAFHPIHGILKSFTASLTIEGAIFSHFLHKNWNLKYKTWLGGHTFFYMDLFHGNTNSRVKIYSINND